MAPEGAYIHTDPFDTGDLQVSPIHCIHYTQYGNPNGKPVVFLHGGPGGGPTTAANASFFNPLIYRVVLFDQRGAGHSTPPASVIDNTTPHLVADIEALREHVGVRKWHMVFGGSWGSTLALAYAQAHPSACGSLVLRGVFLGSKAELDLVMLGGLTGSVFPEEWERFVEYLPESRRQDPLRAYHELIHGGDKEKALEAARMWNAFELSVSFMQVDEGTAEGYMKDERWNMAHAGMETHYFVNGCFLEEGQLLRGCERIRHIPMSIVQGRYDVVCPARGAWKVHKAIPGSKLYWSRTAGHSATEPETFNKLRAVCDEYGQLDFHLD